MSFGVSSPTRTTAVSLIENELRYFHSEAHVLAIFIVKDKERLVIGPEKGPKAVM
jgi:hypothetical protein